MSTTGFDMPASAPCKRCAALLYGNVDYCPYCGDHEPVVLGVPDAAPAAMMFPVLVPSQQAREIPSMSAMSAIPGMSPLPAMSGRSAAISGEPTVSPGAGRSLRIAALAVLVLALVMGYHYVDRQNEANRSGEFAARLAQAQGALIRGDLAAAERASALLMEAYPQHPDVRALKAEVDRRSQVRSTQRDQLLDTAQRALQALGVKDTAPAPSPAPAGPTPAAVVPSAVPAVSSPAPAAPSPAAAAPVPPAVEPPATAPSPPAPVSNAANRKEAGCTGAMAAMALCEKAGTSTPASASPPSR